MSDKIKIFDSDITDVAEHQNAEQYFSDMETEEIDYLNKTDLKADNKNKPHYLGHRKRLKEKFLKADGSFFDDYEILELILFPVIPRKDVKPLAKQLLSHFNNFHRIIHADEKTLLEFDLMNKNVIVQFKVMKEFFKRVFVNRITKKNLMNSWSALLEYIRYDMGGLDTEQFRVLMLNRSNILIADELIAKGTIDQTPIYPREIIKRILFYNAAAIILIHNHPSGQPKPSENDIKITQSILELCENINVRLHDHIIVAADKYYSFKSELMI